MNNHAVRVRRARGLILALCGWLAAVPAVVCAEAMPAIPHPSPGETDNGTVIPTAKGAFLGYVAAVEVGLRHHPLLLKAQETARAAEAMTEQVRAALYPHLDGYALQTGGTIRPLSRFNIGGAQNKPTSYVTNVGVLADQLIYDFGRTLHTVLAEQAGKDAAEKDILARRAWVILSVQQAYLRCLRAKRLTEIAQETVRERGIIRDQIAILYKRKLKSKLDLDLISVELKDAEVRLVQARNEVRVAFAELNNAMGVRGAEEYTLEEAGTAAPGGTLETLIQEGLVGRPELLGLTDRIRQAEEHLTAAKRLALPTISAFGMAGVTHFSDAPLNQYAGAHTGQTNGWWGASASVSVPLFTGFFVESRVAEARGEKHKADLARIDLSNRVAKEVTEAYVAVQSASQQVEVERIDVDAARSALTLAKERYRLGLSSIVDVTAATTALLLAEVRLSEATYALQASAAGLAYAVGEGYRQFQTARTAALPLIHDREP